MVLYKNFKKPEIFNKKYKKYFVERLEFRNLINFTRNKRIPIHNWFEYKQAFSRVLVENICKEFKINDGDTVLDPFCGIGTTPLTCKELSQKLEISFNSIGIDIMPLAVFVAKAKLDFDKYDIYSIEKAIDVIKSKSAEIESKCADIELPEYAPIRRSFDPKALKQLIYVRDKIINDFDPMTNQFLKLGLISIIEDISYTKKDGAFLRWVVKPQQKRLLDTFIAKLNSMLSDLIRTRHLLSKKLFSDDGYGHHAILQGDARNLPVSKSSVDLTITSPPYLNRYDYTRIYMLELFLFFTKTVDELKRLRYLTLRSHVEAKYPITGIADSNILEEVLNELSKRKLNNSKIIPMIRGYFDDMYLTLKELYRVSKQDATICLVVGNVRYAGVVVPVDEILLEIGENVGFSPHSVWITRYKGNSAQQLRKYDLNPVRESIVILSKS